jgi:hypothetical protein
MGVSLMERCIDLEQTVQPIVSQLIHKRKHDFTELFTVIFIEVLEVYIMIIVQECLKFLI